MATKNYKAASSATTAASQYGARASGYASKRESDYAVDTMRMESQSNLFGVIGGTIGIGKSLWDTYSENKELIAKAEDMGLKIDTGKMGQWFGDELEFKEKGNKKSEIYTSEHVRAASIWEQYYAEDSMLNTLIMNKKRLEKGYNKPSGLSEPPRWDKTQSGMRRMR